ncbi:MAG: hypothetical protein HOP30_00185 [Cyclobacteriaceae bacterium]|nr:hypothetical protein [Cyclobacteriaceae bacterium]
MDADELKDRLDPLYEAAMQEQQDIKDCIEQITRSAKDFIAQRYSEEIHNLSAEGYRKLGDVIDRHADNLATEIANIIYGYEEE